MKKICYSSFCTGLAGLIILLCQSTQVFGSAYYSTYGNYNPTSAGDAGYYRDSASSDSHVSFSRPVGDMLSIGGDKSYATSSGYADAGRLRMGVSGWAISNPLNTRFTDAYIYTEAANRFTVLPGTSGLSAGDTTTLQLIMRLDGSLRADARSWPGGGWAHADIDAGFDIYDNDSQICGEGEEGCWSPRLAYFGAAGELEASDVYKPYWNYSYSNTWSEYWRYGSNVTGEVTHDLAGETRELDESMYFEASRSFDTGYLTLSFEAIVGHTLDIESYMSTYVNANEYGEASADFDNTFAFGVRSLNGEEIEWEIGSPVAPGPEPVPEPSTMLLLGAGLAGLALWRKRSKAN